MGDCNNVRVKKAELKEKILLEIKKIEQDIKSQKKSSKPVSPDSSIGRITRMEAINSKSISEATLKNLNKTLAGLIGTFSRIDDDEFGLCVECEEEIVVRRLMLLLGTTKCVKCAKKLRKKSLK